MCDCIVSAETANLSPETIAKCVNTLRYLKAAGFRIDAINMEHAERALARVEIEISFQRQSIALVQAAE